MTDETQAVNAYAQWAVMEVYAENAELQVKELSHSWGKFYKDGDKDKEISAAQVMEQNPIVSDKVFLIEACGRSGASSGTTGTFNLMDGDFKVGNYYWDCPWGSKTNTSTWTYGAGAEGTYTVTVKGANLHSGALGNISILCVKKRG